MSRDAAHPLPAKDPFGGGPLVITELESVDSGITVRGRFEVPRFARLSPDQARYLETFLRCRGMLNSVEKELGISYPTAGARLDGVLKALDLHAVREEPGPSSAPGFAPIEDEAPQGVEPNEEPLFEVRTVPEWEPGEPEDGASFEMPAEEAATIGEQPPVEAEPAAPRKTRDELLSMLERGEIGVDEVKKELERAR